jgi:hypothetical protein
VPPVPLESLQEFALRTAGARHDEFSQRALARALQEYLQRRGEAVGRFEVRVDGQPYPSVFAAMLDPGVPFDTGELRLVEPPADANAWEWLDPFERVVFGPDGAAEVHLAGGDRPPQRAIARLLLRDHYVPRPKEGAAGTGAAAATGDLSTQLDPLPLAVRFVRTSGVIPFSAVLVLYFSDHRGRLVLDLLDDLVLKDARAGHLPLDKRVHRSARVAHAVDRFIALNSLPVASARALEVLVETHGLTPLEVAPMVGGVKEYGASALQGLTARGLATFDRRTGVYRPRFDAFLSAEDRAGLMGAPARPLPHPELRSSVMELQAAADSRATCPLCGDALPAGPRTILCDRCQIEVGQSPDAGAPW